MADRTARPAGTRAKALAGLFGALAIANSAAVAKGSRAGEWATKPLLMPVLTAFLLAAARDRRAQDRQGLGLQGLGLQGLGLQGLGLQGLGLQGLGLPAAGMLLGGLGDTALLASETRSPAWFVPGMGCFAAGHACYLAALAKDGAAKGIRPRIAAGYAAAWAVLIAVLWRRLGDLRVPVTVYSLLLVAMAVLASGRNREAAAGGALFAASDALIAARLAGLKAFPRQEAAVMPAYLAAQFLLAAGWLRPRSPQARARRLRP